MKAFLNNLFGICSALLHGMIPVGIVLTLLIVLINCFGDNVGPIVFIVIVIVCGAAFLTWMEKSDR